MLGWSAVWQFYCYVFKTAKEEKIDIKKHHIEWYVMPVKRLEEFLDKNNIKYTSTMHSPAYTSQEIAAAAHIPGKELAKPVMLAVDGVKKMAVLPASYEVNFDCLKEFTQASSATLVDEDAFKDMFPDCEVGAMPPFGNLYGVEVFVDSSLSDDEEIAFQAGSHKEVIKMAYTDFERLVKPKPFRFAEKRKG